MSEACDSRKWSLAPADEHSVVRLAADTGLSHVVARILVSRGIESAEQAKRFIEPSLGRDWLDPSLIPGNGCGCRARRSGGAGRRAHSSSSATSTSTASAPRRWRDADLRRWGRRSTRSCRTGSARATV